MQKWFYSLAAIALLWGQWVPAATCTCLPQAGPTSCCGAAPAPEKPVDTPAGCCERLATPLADDQAGHSTGDAVGSRCCGGSQPAPTGLTPSLERASSSHSQGLTVAAAIFSETEVAALAHRYAAPQRQAPLFLLHQQLLH